MVRNITKRIKNMNFPRVFFKSSKPVIRNNTCY